MRGTKLSDLRQMLKAECGDSLDVGSAIDGELDLCLANKQRFLASQKDWDDLVLRKDVAVVASSRYANLPELNYNRPVHAEVYFNERWVTLDYGVGPEQYNYLNPDRGDVMDPIQRWQKIPVTDKSVAATFELWPLPATAQTIRFWGQQALMPLKADDDVCTLDDLLIVLYCAAERLARADQRNAQAKLAAANQLAATLQATNSNERLVFGINKVGESKRERRRVPIVLVHG